MERLLIDEAIELADQRRVRFLELRQEHLVAHSQLNARMNQKVHMRLALPASAEALFREVGPKVRNQIRKGEKSGLTVHWGRHEVLDDFYSVFCQNMRDLGTPVYGRSLFRQILQQFPNETELCITRQGTRPVACALLLHGRGITEVPSASCLREANPLCANMLMYWHLLQRSIERKQATFDFGRCTLEGGPYKFKTQWGAEPHAAHWQYYTREGQANEMRPDNPRFSQLIRLWQQLPVAVTRILGPSIVRCIP
jgi:FemAB-related protein (PEP-CTERM system-associated)